jgi:pimeloyl-ACP methyl ester carboxylesterase
MPLQKIHGIQIYYEEYGTGSPVLLIQGLGYPSGMWFLQVPELAKYFRTIVFDNRGVARTDKPDEEYTVAQMAADAVGLLQSLRIQKAHIVGVSLGGYIAQELALTYPEFVDRLVLIATSCGGPRYMELTKDLWSQVTALAGLPPQEIIRQGMALATTEKFFQERPEIIDRSVAIRMENVQPLFAFRRQFAAANHFDSQKRVQHIHHPTLILAGAQDRVMPSSLTQELAQKISTAQLHVYPDGAHLLFLEKAQSLNQEIIEFLSN